MRSFKNITTLSLLLAVVLILCTACGDKVNDDIAVSDISDAISKAIGAEDNLAARDDNYITHMIGIAGTDYAECVVMTNTIGTSVDEYGVFKGADEAQAYKLAESLQAYLQAAKTDSLRFSYTPEELPKVEKAIVTTIGNYVMYSILGDSNRSSALEAFEKSLKEG